MNRILVVAPHPDDETIGCGGTLLRHVAEGDDVQWLIITEMQEHLGFSQERIMLRKKEIQQVRNSYKFSKVYQLPLPSTQLDKIPIAELVQKISHVFQQAQPNVVYLPYQGDVHTDHQITFDATVSCTKWFRNPTVKRILAYETLSETEFCVNPDANSFRPNVFVDISPYFEKKLKIMQIYDSELNEFPFPRSLKTLSALANLRGSTSGHQVAEAFMLLKEII